MRQSSAGRAERRAALATLAAAPLRRAIGVGLAATLAMSLLIVAEPVYRANAQDSGAAGAGPSVIEPMLPSFVPNDQVLSFSGARLGEDASDAVTQSARRSLPTAASPDLAAPAISDKAPTKDAKGGATLAALPSDLKMTDPMVAPVPPAGPPPNDPIPDVIAAKNLFGAAKSGSPLSARAIGSYARGCLSGGVQLPATGPAWQAMRLSRNRNWGHPKLVALVEKLGLEAQEKDGWPGLLVGDISQPRGGPMLTGHRSHQVGLDADIWLTPMPNRKLTRKERERISAISMLDKTDIAIDPKKFTDKHMALIKRASLYPDVERIFVHPAIKQALCERAGEDRGWLGKVRPIPGHHYHFHIRMGCPPEYKGCKPQVPPTGADGCGKEVRDWIARVTPYKGPPIPKPPGWKPPKPRAELTMAQLPGQCTTVLEAGADGIPVPAPPKPTKLIPIAEDNSPYAKSPSLSRHLRRLKAAGN